MTELFFQRKTAVILLLFTILAAGFHIRFDNIDHWFENKSRYFSPVDNTPVSLAVDSYYYLDIAQEFLAGDIEKTDRQRQAPGSYERPVSLPLLSLALALLTEITNKPLEWIATVLPPFLGVLLAIPVYFLTVLLFSSSSFATGRATSTSANIAGLAAALFVLISPAYVERSSIGWCDTDILNVTLLCSLTLFALHSAIAANTRYLIFFLACFTLLTVFFLLWWDQATAPVAGFALGYFFLAAMFNVFSNRSNSRIFFFFLLALCLVLLMIHGGAIMTLPEQLFNMIKYTISNDTAGTHFPYAGQLVAEQQDVSFAEMARKIAGNKWLFSVAAIGLFVLAVTSRKHFLFIIPWLVLSFLAVRSHRLMIFPGVLFGLGIGTVIFFLSQYLKKWSSIPFLPVLAVTIALAWFPHSESQKYFSRSPDRSPQLLDSFKQIAAKIPEGSIIWASWGNGHPLVFYTKSKTIGDGIYHPPELVYSQYLPLATTNFRLAANWIGFYSTHGMEGLERSNNALAGNANDWTKGIPALQELLISDIDASREILLAKHAFSAHAAENFLSFIYPSPPSPVYLLLDYVTYNEQWFPWGTLSFDKPDEKSPYTMVPVYSPSQSSQILKGRSKLGNVTFDLLQGLGNVGGTNVKLRQVILNKNGNTYSQLFNALPWGNTLLLQQNKIMAYGALVDNNVLNTVFTKMFLLNNVDETFFQPVFNASPLVRVFQVKGDVYPDEIDTK